MPACCCNRWGQIITQTRRARWHHPQPLRSHQVAPLAERVQSEICPRQAVGVQNRGPAAGRWPVLSKAGTTVPHLGPSEHITVHVQCMQSGSAAGGTRACAHPNVPATNGRAPTQRPAAGPALGPRGSAPPNVGGAQPPRRRRRPRRPAREPPIAPPHAAAAATAASEPWKPSSRHRGGDGGE